MSGPLRVLFMGGDAFGMSTLRTLAAGGPEDLGMDLRLVGVVTGPDRPAGRGRKLVARPVKCFGAEIGVPVLQPARIRDTVQLESAMELHADLIVVASYGQIIPRRLLEAPPYGCLNLHPSLLPLYRGPAPISGAILAGETVTGTTLMLMSERLDEGPILARRTTFIGPEETAGELESRLAVMSTDLLMAHVGPWIRGEIQPEPQDHTQATYTRLLRKSDGLLDWSQRAKELSLQVRAFNPWPVAFTSWHGRQLRVLRAGYDLGQAQPGRVTSIDERGAAVGTAEGLLLIHELQLPGSRALTAQEFIRGHKSFLGALLG